MPAFPGVPIAPIDTTTAEFARDPLANHDRLRGAGRVVYVPSARALLVTRHDDVGATLRDTRLRGLDYPSAWGKVASLAGRDFGPVIRLLDCMPFVHEGERHTRLRNVLANGLARIAGGHPDFDASVAGKVAAMRRRGGGDIARDVSRHLFFDMMCDLMQIPAGDRPAIAPLATMSWVIESSLSVKRREEVSAQVRMSVDYLEAHARATIGRTRPGFLDDLFEALPPDEEDKFTAVALFAAVLIVMGNDAIGACVSMGVRRLLDPELPSPPQAQWHALANDVIRFVSPIDFILRIATTDREVAGCPVAKGQNVFASLFAANHDPDALGQRHAGISLGGDAGLAFGAGRHLCVGQRLARTVVQLALGALGTLPPMRLSGAAVHGPGIAIRTLVSLPVEFI